jgi:hypothetical protein
MKLKYFLSKFEWMKVYFSPFKPPVPRFYIGKVAIGTPYFYPRVWKSYTPKQAKEAAEKEIRKLQEHNIRHSDKLIPIRTFEDYYREYLRHKIATPKKIGFDFVDLGWKIKWGDKDYRFEWNPVWSFVFFKWQIAITFIPPEYYHYWECWLYYSRETKGTVGERLEQARKEFPCVWTSRKDNIETKVCYWDSILKGKYLKNN